MLYLCIFYIIYKYIILKIYLFKEMLLYISINNYEWIE